MKSFPPRLRPVDLLVGLLLIHILWGALRVPGKVWGERLADIAAHRDRGPVAFHLDNRYRQGAAAVARVLAAAPPEAVVLWRGQWRNALEFVPPLIAPRLLVDAGRCPPGAVEYHGRPLASGALAGGRRGVFVLVGHGDHLTLEVRRP